MAGSWNHIVKKDTGELLNNEDANEMLENGGDWYEFAEEAYGMIHWLANQIAGEQFGRAAYPDLYIKAAQENYKAGLEMSPGTDGEILDALGRREEDLE